MLLVASSVTRTATCRVFLTGRRVSDRPAGISFRQGATPRLPNSISLPFALRICDIIIIRERRHKMIHVVSRYPTLQCRRFDENLIVTIPRGFWLSPSPSHMMLLTTYAHLGFLRNHIAFKSKLSRFSPRRWRVVFALFSSGITLLSYHTQTFFQGHFVPIPSRLARIQSHHPFRGNGPCHRRT